MGKIRPMRWIEEAEARDVRALAQFGGISAPSRRIASGQRQNSLLIGLRRWFVAVAAIPAPRLSLVVRVSYCRTPSRAARSRDRRGDCREFG